MAIGRRGKLPRFFGLGPVLTAGLLLALSLAFPVTAAKAAVSESAAAKQIAETYNVEVLKVRAGEVDGRRVWLVTVMQPGGDSNSAFQVHVLAVDRETGALVSSFRHHSSGYSLPPLPPGGERP